MTTVKILLLSTAAVVGIGGTSAALTKDKWWPKSEIKENRDQEEHSSDIDEGSPGTSSSCKEGQQDCQVNEPSGAGPKVVAARSA